MKIRINDEDDFTGLVVIDKFDEDDELVKRKIREGICVSDLLRQVTKEKLSLGSLEINLDFDEDGKLVQIEIYS